MCGSKIKGCYYSINLEEIVIVWKLSDVFENGGLRWSVCGGRVSCNCIGRCNCNVDEVV